MIEATPFGAEPLREGRAVSRRHQVLRLVRNHAFLAEARHVGMPGRKSVELDTFPFAGAEAVRQQHLARLVLIEDRCIGRRGTRRSNG